MSFDSLPFVTVEKTETGRKVNAWNPSRTGDYEKDCSAGRSYFMAIECAMKQSGNPLLLSRVIHAQVQAGVWEGVEIGFCHAMAEAVMSTSRA